jgi:HEAT repeat protein
VPAPSHRLQRLTEDPAAFLDDEDPVVRRLAVSALAGRLTHPGSLERVASLLGSDPAPEVRAEAAEVAATAGPAATPALLEAATTEDDPRVVEAIATALGEREEPAAVPWLVGLAGSHRDRMVREAAVAALGAIGDPTALPVLLDLVRSGPPQVRRRCVVALTAFDGSEVKEALDEAVQDRNPMVREAAEMVVGRPFDDGGWAPVRFGDGDDDSVSRGGAPDPP